MSANLGLMAANFGQNSAWGDENRWATNFGLGADQLGHDLTWGGQNCSILGLGWSISSKIDKIGKFPGQIS